VLERVEGELSPIMLTRSTMYEVPPAGANQPSTPIPVDSRLAACHLVGMNRLTSRPARKCARTSGRTCVGRGHTTTDLPETTGFGHDGRLKRFSSNVSNLPGLRRFFKRDAKLLRLGPRFDVPMSLVRPLQDP